MDIDLLSKMVKELILDNDRVVLPGLGCFVAELVPSTFSDKGYTINPPYRRLYFRSKPDTGDELVKFYAHSNNVSMEMADRIITDFVAELRSVLHLKKAVVFPGLGRLRATKENNVFFVADEDLDIYPDGFGLAPVSLKTNQETAEEVSAAVVGLKSLLEEQAPETPVVPVVQGGPSSVLEPVCESEPEPLIEPQINTEPVPVSEPEPQPEPEPEPTPVPEPQPVPEPVPTSEPTPAPAVEAVSVIEPVPVPEQAAKPKRKALKRFIWTMVIILVLAAILFGAFVVISRVQPELLDTLLYSKDELEIINYKL